MKGFRVYKAALAALVIGSVIAACSSGGGGGSSTPTVLSEAGGKPVRAAKAWNLGSTQPTATGAMIAPLSATFSAFVGTVASTSQSICAAQSGANPCPNDAFSSVAYSSNTAQNATFAATTLTGSCTAPASAPSPAPGFTAGCYVVAYEGGVGPYLIQGPVVDNGNGTLSVPAQTAMLYFNGGFTQYNFFLAYVTSISAAPPPVTPGPLPTATIYPTPTPVPTATPSLCGKFAVLSTDPAYSNVHFEHSAIENGDVGNLGPAGSGFHVEQQATIYGTAHVAPGEAVQVSGATITGGVVTDQATVASAVANAEALSAADAALPATIALRSVNIGNKQSQTINGSAGVNVLSLSSLEMGHDTTLTLNAPAGSKFVVNVAGEMKVGNTAQILLSGGITPAGVVFNFPGSNGQVWVQFTSVVNGTILAPYRTNLHVDHTTTINGAVVGDGAVMNFAWGDVVGTNCGF